MAADNHPTFSLFFVAAAVVSLLFAGGAEARFKGINPWCLTADYRFLCTKMVKGATTQEVAIANAVQATLNATTRMAPKLEGLVQAVAYLPELSKESVISTCRDSYDKVVENLNEALNFMKVNDDQSVLDRVDTAESSISDCLVALKEMGGNTESLAKTSRILYRYVSNAMAVATQL
ncbi:hypothetical protein Acr_06g0001980 [Actinidia rufa]|uniref:Pectinesterase inhibitor domain-containing protein n=1 Tax=Actinidia rufa TaxID=165716 RepID=A0A7J0EP42_9ERIC|nr:hypothetical protein Acr_06g0001980 [Actinidia rufa]